MKQKVGWAVGSITDNLMMNGLNLLVMPIYNIALGVNPVMLGYALAIPRVMDTLIDPFIGNYSDNLRTRWGRRRPLIVLGAIIMAFFYALVWLPPSFLGHDGLFWYFLTTCFFLYIGYGIFIIPYMALGFELTTDYHERTRVQAWRMIFAYAGGLLMPWLYKLTLLPAFGGNEVHGVRVVGPLIAIIGLLASLTPALLCREKAGVQGQPPIRLIQAFKYTLSNGPFLMLVGAIFLVMLATNLSTPFSLYLNIFYVCTGNKEFAAMLTGWSGTMQGLSGLLSAPLISALGTRFSKKRVIICGQGLALAGYLVSWFLITPAHPYLQLIPAAMIFPGMACIWLLVGSLIADICDDDELKNNLRREGMFGAVMMTIAKAGIALVTVVSGYMLVLSGYIEAPTQTPATLQNMRLMYVFIPAALLGLSMLIMGCFPITEQRAHEIRALLEERQRSETAEPEPVSATV
jgi:GPH family glycoside/pentoside/hexuronide:cation symporter